MTERFPVNRRAAIGKNRRAGKYQYMVAEQLNSCPYCGKDISDTYEMDHIIPITMGGGDADNNLVPVCRSCNSTKNNKSLLVFLATRTTNAMDKYWARVGYR